MSVSDLAATDVRDGVPQAAGKLVHLRLRGPLTASTAPRLRSVIDAQANEPQCRLLVDLEAVTAVDASGIALLLEAQRAIEATATGRVFVHANPLVTWALKRSGTITAFRLWPASVPAGTAPIELV
jgi:anti-anti-sigma factor